MVERFDEGLSRFLKVCEIHNPTCCFTNWTGDLDLDLERMPMKSMAFVILGNIG